MSITPAVKYDNHTAHLQGLTYHINFRELFTHST